MTPVHVPQNLDDAILDLRRCQLAQQILLEKQQQRTTQDYRAEIIRVEAERQRQVEKRQLEQQRVADELEVLQVARRVELAPIVQINLSQTSFGHISTNSLTIPTVLKPA